MRSAMWIVTVGLGTAAAVCAFTAAYVYLRGPGDRLRNERLARRWLAATAVLGVSAIVCRFLMLLLFPVVV